MKSTLFVLVIVAYLATGDTLKCYTCKNPPDEACGHKFDKNGVGVRSQDCAISAKCFKKIEEFSTGNHTTRGCVVELINLEQRQGHLREPIIEFCDTDLCNGASSITAALSTFMTFVTVLIFWSHN